MKQATGAVLAAFALGFGFLGLRFAPNPPVAAEWRGYRVLLVDDAVSEAEVLGLLSEKRIAKVVSESTEPVLVSDWSKLEVLGLAEARREIAPEDPRMDDYLQRLGLWFKGRAGGRDCRVYYIDEGVSPARISEALASKEGSFFLPGEGGTPRPRGNPGLGFFLALLAIAAGSLCAPYLGKSEATLSGAFSRRRRSLDFDKVALRLSMAAPWLPLAWGGGDLAALASLGALAAIEAADILDIPLDEFRRGGAKSALRGLLLQERPPVLILLCALAGTLLLPGAAISLILAFLGSAAGAAGYALASSGQAPKRYVPLPIVRRRRRGMPGSRKARALLASLIVAVWAVSGIAGPKAEAAPLSDEEYPRPSPIPGSARPTIAEARGRLAEEKGEGLPGIASYAAHKAFQESLPFMRLGDPPAAPFSELVLPQPGGEGRVIGFDDGWARRTYASVPSGGVEAMLLAQGEAVVGRGGASRPREGLSAGSRPLAPIRWLLYILLSIAPLARFSAGFPAYGKSPSEDLRQEA